MKYKQVHLVCNQRSHQNSLKGKCKEVRSSCRPNSILNICFFMSFRHVTYTSEGNLAKTFVRPTWEASPTCPFLFSSANICSWPLMWRWGTGTDTTWIWALSDPSCMHFRWEKRVCTTGKYVLPFASKSVGSFTTALEWHASSPSQLEIIFAWSGNGVEGNKYEWQKRSPHRIK